MHREELKAETEEFQKAVKDNLNLMRFDSKRYDVKNISNVNNPYM